MSTVTIDLPEDIEADIEEFLAENPQYVGTEGKTEFVRDAILLYLHYSRLVGEETEPRRLSEEILEDIRVSEEQFERGQTKSHEQVKRELLE